MKLIDASNINIIRRGMRYYRSGRVIIAKKHSDTQFSGAIKGSKGMIYDVFIDINHHELSTCTCPCKIICKHMLCLLFQVDIETRKNALMKIDNYITVKKEKRKQYYDNKKELINFLFDIYNGINPYNGEPIEKDSFLTNPESIRKIYAIILELKKKTPVNKRVRDISLKDKINYSLDSVVKPKGVYITDFITRVNEIRVVNGDKKISSKKLNDILITEGYLYFNEKGIKVPTYRGEECGMTSIYKNVRGIKFYTIEYNMFAQKELIKIIDKYF